MAPKQASSPSPRTPPRRDSRSIPDQASAVHTKLERSDGESKTSQGMSVVVGGSDDENDIEGTIITDGALSISSRSVGNRKKRSHDLNASEDGSDSRDAEEVQPKRHIGFPPPEELPSWFPENIKAIYQVDRHGGALSFKELDAITRYRALIEIVRRRKWKKYLKAGEARWKLQNVVRRLKSRPLSKKFYEFQKKQFDESKEKALRSWKKLEKVHQGTLILDETININFRQERMIYAKKLRTPMH
ncbi:uncharacterized protein PAC_19757 [Phialocephala subalpina]|uniref:Uncharacterized protein n=1 Tax=Phialocephala subalpina TaxID=576137 RepID=A0A1L7XXV9_9HELO|nr:uncharacterized protein PAC_19757 [Phialocephala subalpina]